MPWLSCAPRQVEGPAMACDGGHSAVSLLCAAAVYMCVGGEG